jgi:hypothetical protein
VELDPTIQPFLDDVFSNLSLRVESQKLNHSGAETELWFAHSSEDSEVIVASIGEQRVGVVEADAQAALIEALTPADARGELAWTEAWLYRRVKAGRKCTLLRRLKMHPLVASLVGRGAKARSAERSERSAAQPVTGVRGFRRGRGLVGRRGRGL